MYSAKEGLSPKASSKLKLDLKKLKITLSDISLLSTAEKLIKMVEKKLEENSKLMFDDVHRL